MKLVLNKEKCFGCMACVDICSQDAIKPIVSHDGFLYPYVDTSKCINCKMCERVCPAKQVVGTDKFNKTAYAVKAKDIHVQQQSQSGGAAYIIASKIIQTGGIVYGVQLDEQMTARHVRVDNIDDLASLQGSKYVQSYTSGMYRQIKRDLDAKKIVVLFGTPCQCQAARFYFNKYCNLYIVDIVCHGVPSPGLWRSNIKHLEKKNKLKIKSAEFRDKSEPWGKSLEKYTFEDGTILKSTDFLKLFYSNSFSRLCCSNCQFTNCNRVGDISIGDFWGCNEAVPEMCDSIGVSVLFTNNDAGEKLFDSIVPDIIHKKITIQEACLNNEPLNHPARKSKWRFLFVCAYRFFGMRGILFLNRFKG